jgi:hypothetical protein
MQLRNRTKTTSKERRAGILQQRRGQMAIRTTTAYARLQEAGKLGLQDSVLSSVGVWREWRLFFLGIHACILSGLTTNLCIAKEIIITSNQQGQVTRAVSRQQPLFFEVVPLDSNRIMSFVTVETHHL